ncbi:MULTISPECIES: hypothetical protein [unclassified Streptomyces]|uniref:hypothetical protein n=1 Tax=unclassified Streptomyces TaxID=2593676 RepID=UPI003439727E
MTEQTPETHPAVLELARVRAGLAAGLTVEQSARLIGTTDEELTADAQTLATELSAATAPQAPRVGGARGVDVGNGAGTVAGGAARYRQKAGLDDGGKRAERRPVPTDGRNPFAENRWENR